MAIALVYHGDPTSNCYRDLRIGTFDMSHAGQESHWFAVSDGRHLDSSYNSGIVDIMNNDGMTGFMGVSRNSSKPGARPVFSHSPKYGDFALAFDGYLRNGEKLREKRGGRIDADVAARFIADANDFQRGVENLAGEAKGHFCLAMATERGEGYATRWIGIRPLVYGIGESGHALVTESRALSHIGMERVRDIEPGEIVAIDGSGMHTLKQMDCKKTVCSFLWPYYQMIDCVTEGIEVAVVRSRIGAMLGGRDREAGLVIDAVAVVPDSGSGYEEGYAPAYGCPQSRPLIKYPYAGRSYDRPEQVLRDITAGVKITVVPSRARGKRLAITEDSIRRGTQLIRPNGPIDLLHKAGVRETHLRVCSPRNIAYCRCSPPDGDAYEDEMLAANRFPTDDELAKYLKVNSVRFIGLDDFVGCITEGSALTRDELCLGCYTGEFGFLD